MTIETKAFPGVPAGAVFEAAQKSLQSLNFTPDKEDQASLTITMRSGGSWNSFSKGFTLSMEEVGTATELTITISPAQPVGDKENDETIARIFDHVSKEIDKIRDEGRIAPPPPQVIAPIYTMGQVTPSASQPKIAAPQSAPSEQAAAPIPPEVSAQPEKKSESSSSGGSAFFRVVFAGAAIFLLFTDTGKAYLSSFLKTFTLETDVAKYDCDMVADLVKGERLQNVFGGTFSIVSISTPRQVSKTDDRIVCNANMDLSNGRSQSMRMTVEKGGSSGEIRYRVEPN